jgi:hypothetical protein
MENGAIVPALVHQLDEIVPMNGGIVVKLGRNVTIRGMYYDNRLNGCAL